MAGTLGYNSYGKSKVRLTKVVRGGGGVHELYEFSVDVQLRGDFEESYTSGDNTRVVATDSMKNTVYVLAKERSFASPEEFAEMLARHFVEKYGQVEAARVDVEQTPWQRIAVGGGPHPHAFVGGGTSERRVARAHLERETEELVRSGGVKGLVVLKTTGSEFHGFVADRYRTLKDTSDRIFATSLDAEWLFSRGGEAGYNASYDAIRAALLETFANHHSLAVQQTLLAMGQAALAAAEGIGQIHLEMPNRHRIPFNLEPFGLKNENDIFVTTDEPHGLITGVVIREGR